MELPDHRSKFQGIFSFFPSEVDALLEFDCSAQDLNNGVINCSFMLLFRDLIRFELEMLKSPLSSRLFACYNDGVINLLEKYFDMQKKGARDALGIVAFLYIFCIALLRYM